MSTTPKTPQGATFETLSALDARLAKSGVPPLTAWWRDTLRDWYRHPTARTLAVCAGRGSAKSTMLYKIALNETIFGDFLIPTGERHWASLTSRMKDEAAKGIDILSAWLKIIGVRHALTDGVIEMVDMPRGVRITAASVGGNTGWRSFFDGSDEVGKWPAEGALAVDAAEVLASKRAMTATHPTARHMIVSTPFIDAGPFHDLITGGSNAHAVVAGPVPTWVVAPHISEAQTRKLEPNERVHAREYGAAFAVEWQHGYFHGLIDRCVQPWPSRAPEPAHTYVVAFDPAFSRDLFAIAVAHAERDGVVVVDRVHAITPPRNGSGLSPTECLVATREIARGYRQSVLLSDQHHAASLADLAAREQLTLRPIPWTATNKSERFELVRVLMRDDRLRIPNDAPLRRELAGIGTRLLSSGVESIQGRTGYTDDRVAALVLAVSEAATRARSATTAEERQWLSDANRRLAENSRWFDRWGDGNDRGFG